MGVSFDPKASSALVVADLLPMPLLRDLIEAPTRKQKPSDSVYNAIDYIQICRSQCSHHSPDCWAAGFASEEDLAEEKSAHAKVGRTP